MKIAAHLKRFVCKCGRWTNKHKGALVNCTKCGCRMK